MGEKSVFILSLTRLYWVSKKYGRNPKVFIVNTEIIHQTQLVRGCHLSLILTNDLFKLFLPVIYLLPSPSPKQTYSEVLPILYPNLFTTFCPHRNKTIQAKTGSQMSLGDSIYMIIFLLVVLETMYIYIYIYIYI